MIIATNFQTILLYKTLPLNATEVLQLEAFLNVYCIWVCVCIRACVHACLCLCIYMCVYWPGNQRVQGLILVRPPWYCFMSKNFIHFAPVYPLDLESTRESTQETSSAHIFTYETWYRLLCTLGRFASADSQHLSSAQVPQY